MAKEKVYKLAQEFKVSSEALVQMLRGMGIPVKSHMSTVDESLRDDIKKKFEQERAEIKKEYERKKQMLTRAREELIGKPEEETQAASSVSPVAGQPQAPAQVPLQETAPGGSVKEHRGERELHPRRAFPRERSWGGSGTAGGREQTYIPRSPQSSFAPATTAPAAEAAPGSAGKTSSPGRKDRKDKKKPRKRNERPEIDELQLKANIKKTLAKIGSGFSKKKYKKDVVSHEEEQGEGTKNVLNVAEFVTVNELANMMNVAISEVIAKCLEFGLFVTINQRLDFEAIEMVADEFNYKAQLMTEYVPEVEEIETDTSEGQQHPRAPVVTVMGHVDHGKTSLLDYIRKANVISGEAGGITQHIAAYEVQTPQGPVTFLDTPGHEAFTAMRARGSQITDVIVLVVAADSGVMPQTKEAIDHARAAGVPLVVAINKIDLPTANIDRIKGELAQYNVLVEDYGGQVSCVEISAKTGQGIDRLLEVLALETEILELKANPEGRAQGVVIESELDKGKGPIATVLVQKGTLRKSDAFVTGTHYGRVRELYNERGQMMEGAGPSKPVLVLGLSGTPQAGDSFRVVDDEKDAREISARRRLAQKEREIRHIGTVSLDNLYEQIKAGSMQTLNLIIKGDVDGSVEALAASLEKLSTDEIKVCVIHKSVGAVTETDVNLAITSTALIIGFHLSPNSKIRDYAKRNGVEIRTYRIIYEVLDDVRSAMEGMLKPEIQEKITGTVVVRKVFRVSKVGTIAGSIVESGAVHRGDRARLIRDDIVVAEGRIGSLKRVQEDVREVQSGYECGLTIDNFSDYREEDRIEIFEEVEVARKLTSAVR